MATLFEMPQLWEKTLGPSGHQTCGAQYLHTPSGWVVRHCGHPTANFPYYIETPRGRHIYAPNGRGFQLLKDAKQRVEEEYAKSRKR